MKHPINNSVVPDTLVHLLPRLLVIIMFACVGGYLLYISHAATPFLSRQPENGTLTAPAKVITDATASAGGAVQFARDTPPPPPPPPGDLTDVSYGSDPEQKLDIYLATSGQVSPAVILVHGGGWTKGDKSELNDEAKQLAANGFTVFNTNYRLVVQGKEKGYPEQIDDMKAVVAFILAHSAQYRVDPDDINMLGGSSAGHVVMLTSLQMNNSKAGSIKAVAELSGPTDLTAPGAGGPADGFLGCKIATQCSDALVEEASPIYNITPKCPAIYLVHSKLEEIPVSQAQTMYNKLITPANACVAKLTLLDGNLHAFAYWDQVDDSVIQWLSSH